MVSKTRGQASPHKLRFSDKLVGKAHGIDAMQKKLRALHTELADIDQDNVDTASLSTVRKELITSSILHHKDKGVRAYAACCLADLLRLYAPDAPYTGAELQDIFQFFSRQISLGLKEPDAPNFTEYYYLLESLSNVKSIVLVCDLPHADALMLEIFKNFFDLVRQDMPANVQAFMSDILVALLEESSTLSQDILEIILAQFMPKQARGEQPGYRLAVDVCNTAAARLQRHVSQYFTDIILQHNGEEDLADLKSAHELIKQLNRACPAILLNVVPQLEEELRLDVLEIRLMATHTLGEMFGEKATLGSGELPKKYPTTWKTWLQRKIDKAPQVRIALVDSLKGLLVYHPELRAEVEEALQEKLMDPDDKVRVAACKVCSQVDYETVVHHMSEKTLRAISGRILDKKPLVRLEAVATLSKLYRLGYNEIESGDPLAVSQLSWVPQALLHALAMPANDLKAAIESAFFKSILPLPHKPDDDVAWTEQLMVVMRSLDDKAMQGLLSIAGINAPRSNLLDTFIQCCAENNGGVMDNDEEQITKRLQAIIQQLSASLPEPVKVSDDLLAFAELNDNRSYKLIRSCTDTQADLKVIVKARSEFFRRMEENSASLLSTFKLLWQRYSLWVVNSSSIPSLVKKLQRSSSTGDVLHERIASLLSHISKNCPAIYKAHVSELAKALADEKNNELVALSLHALSAVFRWDPDLAPNDRRLIERATRFAEGAFSQQAKFAARLLAHARNKTQLTTQLIHSIADLMPSAEPEHLVAHLSVVAELARSAPDAFESSSDIIMAFILKDLLLRATDSESRNEDEDWAEDSEVPSETNAKVLALKICANRCIAHAASKEAMDVAKPVVRLLLNILESRGVPFAGVLQNPVDKSRLRLQAGLSLLKITTHSVFDKLIGPNLLSLALMVQDTCYGVRAAFINKLVKYGLRRRLTPKFNVIPFLTAHDPENELREKARLYVLGSLRRMPSNARVACFEIIFVRLLHLLAHHPDFSSSGESLNEIAKYIDFYVDLVCSAENVSLLWHLALKLKTVEDSDPAFTENLYIISELAQHVIKRRAKTHAWTIASYPAKVEMPGDIFRKFPDPAMSAKVRQKVYLSDALLAEIVDVGKTIKPPTSKRPRVISEKKTTANGRKAVRPRKRRKKSVSEDEDAESAASLSQEEDRDEDGDVKMDGEPNEESDLTSMEDGDPETLGRGARGKARARADKKSKTRKAKATAA